MWVAIISVMIATFMSALSNRKQAVDIRTTAIQQVIFELSKTGRNLQVAAQNKNEMLAKFDLAHGLHLIDTGIEAIKPGGLQANSDAFHTAVVRRFNEVAIGFIKSSGISDQDLEESFLRVYRFKRGITEKAKRVSP